MSYFLLAALLSSPTAHAAQIYCEDLRKVQSRVTDCEQNERLAEAAVVCLKGLEAEIERVQKSMESSMGARNAATKDAQSDTLATAKSNYDSAKRSLGLLVDRAQGMISEVKDYRGSLALPEDADEPTITGGDVDAFLAEESCYKDSYDILSAVLEDLKNHEQALRTSRDATLAFESVSGARENKVGADSMHTGTRGTASGTSAPAAATRNWRPSDISGTEKKNAP